jgi:hypothetical protein
MEKGLNTIIGSSKTRFQHWFEVYIEDGFRKGDRHPKVVTHFNAGWAGECPRYIQAAQRAELPYDVMKFKQRKNFEYGNSAHKRYQDALKLVVPTTVNEMWLDFTEGEITIHGKVDVVTEAPDKIVYVIEIKTMGGAEFKGLKAPKPGHLCQWTVYAHHLKCKKGLIVYENKDETNSNGLLPELKIYEVEYDDVLYKKIMDNFQYVIDCNKKDTRCDAPDKCPNYFCELKCKRAL